MLYLIISFIFLFGLIIGSFLNCLIWRLHKKESLMNRSYCPQCRKMIAWYDNIPVLSFIMLGGKCRHCGKKISWQYPTVEIVTAILFLVAFIVKMNDFGVAMFPNYQLSIINYQTIINYQFSISKLFTFSFILSIFRDWFVIAVMIVIFVYDLRWYLILDIVTLPACLIVLVLNLILGISLWNLLISGIIGSSFFLLQFLVSRGKWIGGGDIRLGLLMGLSLGWPNVPVAIFLAYIMGSVASVGLVIAKKKKWGSQIPLGIFLSTATVITLFWGEAMLSWYLDKLFL